LQPSQANIKQKRKSQHIQQEKAFVKKQNQVLKTVQK